MPSEEVDEIDLETEEIIVDRGHLRSLQDSALWDPFDSETENEDAETLNQSLDEVEHFPENREDIKGVGLPSDLPSEKEIMEQFGEEYGRDILAYLRKRTNAPSESGNKDLWAGMEDEEAIFSRAKGLWRQYRMQRSSPIQKRTFDKNSFERVVFGMSMACNMSFEDAVFGQSNADEWTDEEDERRINQSGSLPTYAVDDIYSSPPLFEKYRRSQIESPVKRIRSAPTKSSTKLPGSARFTLSAKAKDKSPGIVVSGLLADTSDEEDDYFDILSSPNMKRGKHALINESPLSRNNNNLDPLKSQNREKRADAESEENDTVDKISDTQGKCGEIGYRCTKAFCFTCVT